jgi:hypothetical protein
MGDPGYEARQTCRYTWGFLPYASVSREPISVSWCFMVSLHALSTPGQLSLPTSWNATTPPGRTCGKNARKSAITSSNWCDPSINKRSIGVFQVFATSVLSPTIGKTNSDTLQRLIFSENAGKEFALGRSGPPSNESTANTFLRLPTQPRARQQVERPLKLPISRITASFGSERAAFSSQLPSAGSNHPSIESISGQIRRKSRSRGVSVSSRATLFIFNLTRVISGVLIKVGASFGKVSRRELFVRTGKDTCLDK